MKTLEELKSGATITPGEVYEYARAYMDPADIDHHCTDLYIRITPVSRVIVGALDNDALLSTFVSNIEPRALWYELPFCYIPGWTTREI
jgi:hypothetical protein